MSISIDEKQYAHMRDTLKRIARGYKLLPEGRSTNLPKSEIVELARRTCVVMGWGWSHEQ